MNQTAFKINTDIVSTTMKDKPLIFISEEAINLKRDNDKLKREIERLNKKRKTDTKYNKYLQKELAEAHSIIKEAREYIKYQLENLDFEEDTKAKMLGAMVLVLLDKVGEE